MPCGARSGEVAARRGLGEPFRVARGHRMYSVRAKSALARFEGDEPAAPPSCAAHLRAFSCRELAEEPRSLGLRGRPFLAAARASASASGAERATALGEPARGRAPSRGVGPWTAYPEPPRAATAIRRRAPR